MSEAMKALLENDESFEWRERRKQLVRAFEREVHRRSTDEIIALWNQLLSEGELKVTLYAEMFAEGSSK